MNTFKTPHIDDDGSLVLMVERVVEFDNPDDEVVERLCAECEGLKTKHLSWCSQSKDTWHGVKSSLALPDNDS